MWKRKLVPLHYSTIVYQSLASQGRLHASNKGTHFTISLWLSLVELWALEDDCEIKLSNREDVRIERLLKVIENLENERL